MFFGAKIVLVLGVIAVQCRADGEDKKTLLPGEDACGKQKATGTGSNAELGEFPWLAMLRYQGADGEDGGFRCVGSVINERYILASGRCVDPQEVSLSEIRLGEHNLVTEKDCKDEEEKECSDPVQVYGIEKKIPHSGYKQGEYENDIGLIRLNKSIEFTDYVRPICLPLDDKVAVKPGDKTSASGWGRSLTGELIKIKKRVLSAVISREECAEEYKQANITLSEHHLCTRADKDNKYFTCGGDAGGPLMSTHGDQVYQTGIVSFGVGCGRYPDGNTDLAKFVSWILENVEA